MIILYSYSNKGAYQNNSRWVFYQYLEQGNKVSIYQLQRNNYVASYRQDYRKETIIKERIKTCQRNPTLYIYAYNYMVDYELQLTKDIPRHPHASYGIISRHSWQLNGDCLRICKIVNEKQMFKTIKSLSPYNFQLQSATVKMSGSKISSCTLFRVVRGIFLYLPFCVFCWMHFLFYQSDEVNRFQPFSTDFYSLFLHCTVSG